MANSTLKSSNNALVYLVLGLIGLGLGVLVLVVLYYLCGYLSLNLALALDRSLYGRAGGPLGYALLGLGLGAAAGALAASRRYRLHGGIGLGAAGLLGCVLALVLVPGPDRAAPTAFEATPAAPYTAAPGRVSCGACARMRASGAYAPQNGHTYEAANLLQRDSTTAWISATATNLDNPLGDSVRLYLTVGPLPGHRLTGLRLRNGYCKNAGAYQSFGRLQTCLLRLPNASPRAWTLPDTAHREWFIPLPPPFTSDSTRLTLTLVSGYAGDHHAEVALAWLVPVFEPLGK